MLLNYFNFLPLINIGLFFKNIFSLLFKFSIQYFSLISFPLLLLCPPYLPNFMFFFFSSLSNKINNQNSQTNKHINKTTPNDVWLQLIDQFFAQLLSTKLLLSLDGSEHKDPQLDNVRQVREFISLAFK